MFIVFWDTGSQIFQSDPNNNSDSTAYSDTNLNGIRIAAVGSDLFQLGSQRNRARFKVAGPNCFDQARLRIGPILSARIEFGPELFHIGPDFLLGGGGVGGLIRMGGGGK